MKNKQIQADGQIGFTDSLLPTGTKAFECLRIFTSGLSTSKIPIVPPTLRIYARTDLSGFTECLLEGIINGNILPETDQDSDQAKRA